MVQGEGDCCEEKSYEEGKRGKERGGREGKDCMTNWVNGLKNDVSFWALQINRRRKKKKQIAHLCSWGKNIFN